MKYVLCLTAAAALLLAASPGFAATLSTSYGWEDGAGTILGSFGTSFTGASNVAGGDELSDGDTIYTGVVPNSGSRMLMASETPDTNTPQAYIAYIENLSVGDQVTASLNGWDSTEGGSPSIRIWGHYALNGDVASYAGSAGGHSTYTGTGGDDDWFEVGNTWAMPAGKEALVIEARLYDSPTDLTAVGSSTYFIDDLSVSVDYASGTPQITTPGGTISVPEPASIALLLTAVVALVGVRRRTVA